MQSAYLYVILHVRYKKLPFIAVFTLFRILGDHCSWRHRLPAASPLSQIYLIFLQRSKAFHWRQNRFEILQRIKNCAEGFHPPLPPHPCTTVGVWICVYVRGLSITDKTKIANIPFSTPLLILPIISFLFVFSSPHFDYIYFSFICLLLFVLLSLVINLLSTVVRLI